MIYRDLELCCVRIMPYNWAMHTRAKELRHFLDRRVRLRVKRILAAFSWFPLLNFVCFESERVRICYLCFAQVLHRNRHGRLAVARSKRDNFGVHVMLPCLLPEHPESLD